MIQNNIEFHNAAELEAISGMPGLCPVRFPRSVRDSINPRGRMIAAMSTGVELRFVCPGQNIHVAFAAHESDVTLHVYRGEFGHSDHVIPAGTTRLLQLTAPEQFPNVTPEILQAGPFASHLWRIQISHGTVSFLGLESFGVPVRPPHSGETPGVRWLAYGSSITNSWGKGYPHQAARRLGVDVLNKGLSGSCHCEPEIGAYLAEHETWDFATLELGVNMRGQFTPVDFEFRVRELLRILRNDQPNAPLILITHYLNRQHHPAAGVANESIRTNQLAFDDILRSIASEQSKDRVFLIEGTTILPDFSGLCCDLLHPSDYGHIQMGEILAKELTPILQSQLDGYE